MKSLGHLALLVLMLAAVSCSKGVDKRGIDLQLGLSPELLTDSLYIKMDFQFTLQPDFTGIDADYQVFVHFWREKKGEMLIQDDHALERTADSWKKGDTVHYQRTVYIPKFFDDYDLDFGDAEEIKVSAGLYRPEKPDETIPLFEKVYQFKPAALTAPEIVYDDGWHNLEKGRDEQSGEELEWRWMSGKAVCVMENPKKDYTLIIKGMKRFPEQKLIFRVNDTLLGELTDDSLAFTAEYTLTPQMMGTDEIFFLVMETDSTFIPAEVEEGSQDRRELGLKIFSVYFRIKP